jgi:hypothetical protein
MLTNSLAWFVGALGKLLRATSPACLPEARLRVKKPAQARRGFPCRSEAFPEMRDPPPREPHVLYLVDGPWNHCCGIRCCGTHCAQQGGKMEPHVPLAGARYALSGGSISYIWDNLVASLPPLPSLMCG